jgi:hypothetical protein
MVHASKGKHPRAGKGMLVPTLAFIHQNTTLIQKPIILQRLFVPDYQHSFKHDFNTESDYSKTSIHS